ncbi:MAG: radical SAM protein [Bacteroidetes bacterium]|nr:radical SAM protein [Bacteroidota bacterium]
MATFLFDDMIFGPVKSRRFGVSLGINLLPSGYKYCTFNCIYCECGWTYKNHFKNQSLPGRSDLYVQLENKLRVMTADDFIPDNITFAGNGEPTIHPEFAGIIEDVVNLRNQYFPQTGISVLSNATMLHKKPVFEALKKVNNNVLKLDTARQDTFLKLNQPHSGRSLSKIIDNIKKFDGSQIIQTLFIRGQFNGNFVDNTTEIEVSAWLETLVEISPRFVMIYPIARDTPAAGLEKISRAELFSIAEKAREAGLTVKTYD